MAGGARGYHAGSFDLMSDFPPLMQFLYGLPGDLAATFTLLEKNGVVDAPLADRLRKMVDVT